MFRHMFEALLIGFGLINVPAVAPVVVVALSDEEEWTEYHAEALAEYSQMFEDLFNSIEYKRSKNGRSMVRRPGDKSFRFVKGAK